MSEAIIQTLQEISHVQQLFEDDLSFIDKSRKRLGVRVGRSGYSLLDLLAVEATHQADLNSSLKDPVKRKWAFRRNYIASLGIMQANNEQLWNDIDEGLTSVLFAEGSPRITTEFDFDYPGAETAFRTQIISPKYGGGVALELIQPAYGGDGIYTGQTDMFVYPPRVLEDARNNDAVNALTALTCLSTIALSASVVRGGDGA